MEQPLPAPCSGERRSGRRAVCEPVEARSHQEQKTQSPGFG
jgi:hypothetical protein